MPAAAATRESIARMVGRGHDDIDFAVLLMELASDAGMLHYDPKQAAQPNASPPSPGTKPDQDASKPAAGAKS